jgi:hypothetical protein
MNEKQKSIVDNEFNFINNLDIDLIVKQFNQ